MSTSFTTSSARNGRTRDQFVTPGEHGDQLRRSYQRYIRSPSWRDDSSPRRYQLPDIALAPWRIDADTIATIALGLSAIFAISSLALQASNRRATRHIRRCSI
ncbi:hypothetical protein K466DRAFT_666481 [Polyporus arcularius HHB13444]|uniref:Uncharacterized protein n=1 Tax=Polyporus arcularius HHB13444 TaxID=1314778 RepID=A0A5C3NYH6_9APHY|nr:hypothetical protein K466DRAFT_666481 [Polyporus arcularius HHB13444]